MTGTLWLAFAEDPLWRWAFPEHEQLRPWWRLLVSSALRHRWVWTAAGHAAAPTREVATMWREPG